MDTNPMRVANALYLQGNSWGCASIVSVNSPCLQGRDLPKKSGHHTNYSHCKINKINQLDF